MRGARDQALQVAAYGLLTWYFMTPAAMLLAASMSFIVQGRALALVTLPGGAFLAYVGVLMARRFAAAIHGDRFLF